MPRATRPAAIALATLLLSGCFGYQLGGLKPSALAHVQSIAVPMFTNETLEPRVGVLATNATVSAITADGTYKIKSKEQADAVLEATVKKINYIQIRADRLDTLRPAELENVVTIEWKLLDARDNRVLDSGAALGTSRFFLDPNAQTSRTNALPDAVQNAGRSIASQLGDGF
jgi:hypothetical protein